MSNTIISLKDIVVEFDGQRVLEGLNLDIHDKEFVTFLGPSGCGKTTTLRIIGGFVDPKEGDVFFEGKRINDLPPHKRQRVISLARDMLRNSPQARGMAKTLRVNVVGARGKLRFYEFGPWYKAARTYFKRWARHADFRDHKSFRECLQLAVTTIQFEGDFVVLFDDGCLTGGAGTGKLAFFTADQICNLDEEGFAPFRAIVHGSIFHDVLAMPSMTETIMVGTTESQVVFVFGNTTFIARRIEGNFPNYKQLLPPTCSTSVNIDVESFTAALKRVSVIALSNPSVRFDIDIDGKMMKLSANSPEQGESHEFLPIEGEGSNISIALNYHYVFDCINAASDRKEIFLELQSSMQPGIFKSNGAINYLYLLMPVRM